MLFGGKFNFCGGLLSPPHIFESCDIEEILKNPQEILCKCRFIFTLTCSPPLTAVCESCTVSFTGMLSPSTKLLLRLYLSLECYFPLHTSFLHLIFILFLHWFGVGNSWQGWLIFIKNLSFFRYCVVNLHALFNNTCILRLGEQKHRKWQWALKEWVA